MARYIDYEQYESCIKLILEINRKIESRFSLPEQQLSKEERIQITDCLWDINDYKWGAIGDQHIPAYRNMILVGALRLLFLRLWDESENNRYIFYCLDHFFEEMGEWVYESVGSDLKLVFKRYQYVSGKRAKIIPNERYEYDPYGPWTWLFLWRREVLAEKKPEQIDRMIRFLKKVLGHVVCIAYDSYQRALSVPARQLCYFILSDLYLNPLKPGGPDIEAAREWVDAIANEHPCGLFDPHLSAEVLKHCAEIRLQPYFSSWKTRFAHWRYPEFLQAAPQVFPALHALLCSAASNTMAAVPNTEYIVLLLQTFHSRFCDGTGEPVLPAKDSMEGQICFTLLPRVIEHFMKADRLLADQIKSVTGKSGNHNSEAAESTRITLQTYRERLAGLVSEEISQWLSLPPTKMDIPESAMPDWLAMQEMRVQQKVLAHALQWPSALLQAEEQRLTRTLPFVESLLLDGPRQEAIKALREGRQKIQRLTHQHLTHRTLPASYTAQVQTVLKKVEAQGGQHNDSLTVVARVAANLLIVLSVGLLYPFFRKAIRESHAAPTTGFRGCLFNLKCRRAAVVHHTAQQYRVEI
jgi:hypothetical protein